MHFKIETESEYAYAVSRGFDPLLGIQKLPMDIKLRVAVQRRMFGKHNPAGNQKFYNYCLDNKPLVCEECGKFINHPGAINVSHILTKGAHQDMAFDPRNTNILCPSCHAKWEDATTRVDMRIYRKNQKIIKTLKEEYGTL